MAREYSFGKYKNQTQVNYKVFTFHTNVYSKRHKLKSQGRVTFKKLHLFQKSVM